MRLQLKRYSIVDKFISLIENQKPSDRLLMRVLFFVTLFAGIFFLFTINQQNSSPTPTRGGVLKEGIVGIPRFVNPALAITRADQDATALLYSGLLKINPEGDLEPDIAESVIVSEDGKTYTVIVRKDRAFHDGKPITARDAIYTISLIQNADLKSPLRGNWSEVVIEEVGEYEFTATLPDPYSPFMENFTIGIMPQHIWSSLPIEQLPFSQHNTEPVGSGPFSIKQVKRNEAGLISSYVLKPEPNNQTDPNLDSIELIFFQNETDLFAAFLNKEINSSIYLGNENIAKVANNNRHVLTQPLPRVFGIFFNQNRSAALRDKSAREALSLAVNRDRLVSEVLGGYGVPITKPIIETTDGLNLTSAEDESEYSMQAAIDTLLAGGWKQNEDKIWEKKIDNSLETLSLTIKTSNNDIFEKTVDLVAEDWKKLGVEVQTEQYEQTGLVQSVIRTRDFQALLFGLDMNRTQDLYPFWHSSQKSDPGLNVAQYTNIAVDRLLEKTRNTQGKEERRQLLSDISAVIAEEHPAVMLFAPSVTYVLDKTVITSPIKSIGKPSDRFMNVSSWHAKSEIVWPIFQKEVTKDININ